MKKLLLISTTIITFSYGCNPTTTTETETTTTEEAAPAPMESPVTNDPENQIRGVGLINRGNESITFFEPGNQEQTLGPGESCDYEIANNSAVIKISGQEDQWGLERQKRYQLVIDSSGKWDIEQLP